MNSKQGQIGGRFNKSYGDTVAESGAYVQQGDVGSQDVTINGGLHLHIHSPVHSVSAAGTVVQFLDVLTKLSTLGQHLRSNSVTREQEICQLLPVSTSLRGVLRQLIDELTSSRANNDNSTTAKVCVLALAQSVMRSYLRVLMNPGFSYFTCFRGQGGAKFTWHSGRIYHQATIAFIL